MEKVEMNLDELKSAVQDIVTDKMKSTVKASELDEAIKAAIKPLEDVIEAQGKELNQRKSINVKLESPIKQIMDAYKGAVERNEFRFKFDGTNKAWDSLDTFTVDSHTNVVYPSNGTNANVDAGIASLYRQLFPGISVAPSNVSSIMSFINLRPLSGLEIAKMSKSFDGSFLVTEETALKPVLTGSYSMETSKAEIVAGTWKVSNQFLRYYTDIAQDVRQEMQKLLSESIPNKVLADVIAAASAFTPATGIATETTPNNYDAITALISSLESLKYMPNVIIVHPVAYRNMLALKASDGHYNLQNGNAINIVQNGNMISFQVGGYDLNLIKDSRLGNDDIIIGDMSKFNVALGGSFGFEYYDVTDGDSDARRNLKSFVLEQDIATLLPAIDSAAIVKSTFSEIKTLLTV